MPRDPWAEFVMEPGSSKTSKADPWSEFQMDAPTGAAHDGDTFGLRSGGNARLSGVDAFELEQMGRGPAGASVSLGTRARDALLRLLPGARATPTGETTYGRKVVTLDSGGTDAGQQLVGEGMAVPTPEYLKAEPDRLDRYVDTQREAIAAEAGA